VQYLLLARHGNTFAPGQKVVWVGARNDLPLVESGLMQAKNLATAMKELAIKPETIYAATLKRTVVYAEIIHDQLNLVKDVILDKRLDELDYGGWSSLTSEEIKAQYGEEELKDWNDHGVWPQTFTGSEIIVEEQVKNFIEQVVEIEPNNKLSLAVTSNGRLKYFLKILPDIYNDYIEKSKWKVSTGNICLFGYENGIWKLLLWNENPHSLNNVLKITI
jgi:broad specificity phosphatase PhoE